jgi:hypothetical protein
MDSSNNFVAIKMQGASDFTEIHRMGLSNNYATFNLQTATGLHTTTSDGWAFTLDSSDNLLCIKQQGASGYTEVHRLSASSNYASFDLQTATALHTTESDEWEFHTDSNDNLMCIKRDGSQSTTEVHRLSASSGYTAFDLQTTTALHSTTADSFTYLVDSSDNLVAIKYVGTSSTEVHRLSASSGYATFDLQTATALHTTSAGEWSFALDTYDDLVGIKFQGSQDTVELHTLGKSSNYGSFVLQTTTALHSID